VKSWKSNLDLDQNFRNEAVNEMPLRAIPRSIFTDAKIVTTKCSGSRSFLQWLSKPLYNQRSFHAFGVRTDDMVVITLIRSDPSSSPELAVLSLARKVGAREEFPERIQKHVIGNNHRSSLAGNWRLDSHCPYERAPLQ
jgi:hypothetical protein